MQDKLRVIVKKNALLSALEASKNVFPDEFIGIFRGKRKGSTVEITDLIIPPLSSYEEDYSAYSPWFLPPRMGAVGSYHSHTRGPALPSRQDLNHFAENGPVHFIAKPPFTIESTNCFDAKGKKIAFELK